MPNATILIIDDEESLRRPLADRLQALGYRVIEADNGALGLDRVRDEDPDLVLADLQMPVMDGLTFLQNARREFPELMVVMLTGHGTLETAVEAMKSGAYDFIPKPCKADHIRLVIEKALERRGLRAENRLLREEAEDGRRMVLGEDPGMRRLMAMARQVAESPSTVMIGGESGTGKQVLARAIHAMSGRKDRPFIQVNCTTLSESLLESDLFGHERGAFTGAHQAKKGRVELADGGTLFLDEIGDLSASIQAKLLHFLERGEFERVGGMKTMTVDARVIAATNRNLEKDVKEGRFRGDLYYRLNVVTLALPPLRERPADIRPIAEHFLEKFRSQMRKSISGFTPQCREKILGYTWPGNIRELENAVERAVVLATGPEITPDLLPAQCLQRMEESMETGATMEKALHQFKKQFIRKTLESTQWNQSKAAQVLDIQRTYLSRLIRELNLKQTR
jgi:two-component system response regulator AtoC